MKNNLFDNHVNELLGASRPSVPAHVWDNIFAKKDKKKPIGYFRNNLTKIAAVVVFILMNAGVAFYLLSPKNISKNKQTVSAEINNDVNVPHVVNDDERLQKQAPTKTNEPLKNNINIDNESLSLSKKSSAAFLNNAIPESYENELTEVTNSINLNLKTRFSLIDFKQKKYSYNPTLQLPPLPASPYIPCPEAEKNTAGNKKYIEIYAGPDYVFRNLTDTANSVYLQQRKGSVKQLFAYSAGIRYTKVFGNGMSFRTGLNYSQINEQFKSQKGRITQNVYITNNNGDTTGSYVQSGTQYKTSVNKYKSIDIPLSVGYELGNGRLHANINAGAMINISFSQKGFMLDNAGNTVDISSGKSNSIYQYKTKAGVSFVGATSIFYKLNKNLHLMAEPYVKLSLSAVTRPEISLKEKLHTAGVRVGVRLDL